MSVKQSIIIIFFFAKGFLHFAVQSSPARRLCFSILSKFDSGAKEMSFDS